ncbi:iron-containing alcohol dehydrogenase [Vibrio sp. S17_S38]|uniref:iron-containing alcohol dehydrogenase n=1 Tax=Vibrio sp. S17_S38 TaxID=2720229 RepID=UPI0016802949|nr:iron-containing alcohol dehydrogenase [Vibrio sp. S17_S38]MBD1572664.1 iron-containing alcohol dehydrogenase [Vibrio sp. S17_S38]
MNIFTSVLTGDTKQITEVTRHYNNLLLMTDKNVSVLPAIQTLINELKQTTNNIYIIDDLPAEPTDQDVITLINKLPQNIDMVLGIGGGSVLDISKLISVLYAEQGDKSKIDVFQSLLVGEKPSQRIALTLVPTTAGTGAEATPNAIIALPAQATKVGIISPIMLPDYVLLVPELTLSMPHHITSSTSIDALCHLIECFTASISNPIGDNYALIGMQKFFTNIEEVIDQPNNLLVRLNLLWASYYGGAAISHAGTHLVHALSYPLGGKYKIPHGLANSLLLVPCMKHICAHTSEKFAQVYDLLPSANLALSETEKANQLVAYLENLVNKLQLPIKLNDIGIDKSQIAELAKNAMEVKRLLNNSPVSVTEQEVFEIYNSICE